MLLLLFTVYHVMGEVVCLNAHKSGTMFCRQFYFSFEGVVHVCI